MLRSYEIHFPQQFTSLSFLIFFDKMKSHFVWNEFLNGFLLMSAVFVSRETISRTDEMNMMLSLFAV